MHDPDLVRRGPFAWLHQFLDFLKNSSLPFATYVKSTFNRPSPSQASQDLFACPPPFPWHSEQKSSPGKSRRVCARWQFRRAVEIWTNLMVCALSHQATGCCVAPLRGRCGVLQSSAQTEMCKHLETLARSVVRLGPSDTGCGLRLPAVQDRLSKLREQLTDLLHVPYACNFREFKEDTDTSFSSTQALPVISERLSLPDKVSNFNPVPFLSPLFRRVYEDPDAFLKSPEEMPGPINIRGTASRRELLKVMERWDRLDRLFICKASEVNISDRCELFAVAKDAEKDRQILHRKRRNQREKHFAGASRDLPHGVLLCQLPLEDKFVCVCSVDDVKDFYHCYPATEARAKSSPVGPFWSVKDVSHLQACQAALSQNRINKCDLIACCFKGLGMGDHAAVDIAQESHTNLLKAFGCMFDEETLCYRRPVPNPASGFYEGIMIDDHLGVQLLERKKTLKATLLQPGRDQQVFASSQTAYKKVGLQAHEKKRVRRSFHTKVWGAEIEGAKGLVGPVRQRLFKLAHLSFEAAKGGPIDQKSVEALTGLWAFCAQFRRPMFSFLFELYHQQSPGQASDPFLLNREARNELILLAAIAPLCISDLKVLPDEFIYNVDASPSGAGVCRAWVGRHVSREIWRRGDKLGYRAPLLTALQSALKGSGYDEDFFSTDVAEEPDLCEREFTEEDHPISEKNASSVNSDLSREQVQRVICDAQLLQVVPGKVPLSPSDPPYDFFEIYAHDTTMSDAWAKEGFRVLPPISFQSETDLRRQDIFWAVLGLIRARKVRFFWWSTGCSFRSSKLRTRKKPWGLDLCELRTLTGNLHVCQGILLGLVQMSVGHWACGGFNAGALVGELPLWNWFLTFGAFRLSFDWCGFDKQMHKTYCLVSNAACLYSLKQKHCYHKGKLKNVFQQRVGFPEDFCRAVARLCRGGWTEQWTSGQDPPNKDFVEVPSTLDHFGDGLETSAASIPKNNSRAIKLSSPLWSVQLSESLPWKTWIQYRFRMAVHINLQESKVRRSLVKRLRPNQRVVVAQDSRVNLGAFCKGRSPSKALNTLLRSEAPYILGKNLYLAGIHMPTWSIRADDPSRGRKVSEPRTPLPAWFWPLKAGVPGSHGALDDVESLPRAFNRWFLFGGAMLLRVSRGQCTAARASSFAQPGAAGTRQSIAADRGSQNNSPGQTGNMDATTSSHLGHGSFSSASRRCFFGVARRVHDSDVSCRSFPQRCSRDVECPHPEIWLASPHACSALECDPHVGVARTCDSPPSHAGLRPACACSYCIGMGLAEVRGAPCCGLFWLVETFRAALLAQARPRATVGSPRNLSSLSADRVAQNSHQRGPESTCANRRARCRSLDRISCEDIPYVATSLARVLEGLQTST